MSEEPTRLLARGPMSWKHPATPGTGIALERFVSLDTKRATLVHELGHRLETHLFARDEEEHGPLFLWLYDDWGDLWGPTFGEGQVTVEKRRGEGYVRAWDAATVLDGEERQEAWNRLLDERAH